MADESLGIASISLTLDDSLYLAKINSLPGQLQRTLSGLESSAKAQGSAIGASLGNGIATGLTDGQQKLISQLGLVRTEAQAGLRPLQDYKNALKEQEASLTGTIKGLDRAGTEYKQLASILAGVKGELSAVTREMRDQETASTRLGAKNKGLEASFGAIATIGAGYSLAQFGGYLDQAAQSAQNADVSLKILDKTLASTGQSSSAAESALSRVAQTLGLSQAQISGAATMLVRYGYSIEQIEKVLIAGGASALAFGTSAAKGVENISSALVTENSALLNAIGISENLGPAIQKVTSEMKGASDAAVQQAKAQALVNLITKATGQEVASLPDLLSGYTGATNELTQANYRLSLSMGQSVIPVLSNAKLGLADVLDTVTAIPEPVRNAGLAFGVAATGAIALAAGLGTLRLVLGALAGPAGWIALAVGGLAALGVGLASIPTASDKANDALEETKDAVKGLTSALGDDSIKTFGDLEAKLDEVGKKLNGPAKDAWETLRKKIEDTYRSTNDLKAALQETARAAAELPLKAKIASLETEIKAGSDRANTYARIARAPSLSADYKSSAQISLNKEIETSKQLQAELDKTKKALGAIQNTPTTTTPPPGSGGGLDYTLTQVQKLIPEAKRLQAALNAAAKAGNAEAYSKAAYALDLFKEKYKDAGQAAIQAANSTDVSAKKVKEGLSQFERRIEVLRSSANDGAALRPIENEVAGMVAKLTKERDAIKAGTDAWIKKNDQIQKAVSFQKELETIAKQGDKVFGESLKKLTDYADLLKQKLDAGRITPEQYTNEIQGILPKLAALEKAHQSDASAVKQTLGVYNQLTKELADFGKVVVVPEIDSGDISNAVQAFQDNLSLLKDSAALGTLPIDAVGQAIEASLKSIGEILKREDLSLKIRNELTQIQQAYKDFDLENLASTASRKSQLLDLGVIGVEDAVRAYEDYRQGILNAIDAQGGLENASSALLARLDSVINALTELQKVSNYEIDSGTVADAAGAYKENIALLVNSVKLGTLTLKEGAIAANASIGAINDEILSRQDLPLALRNTFLEILREYKDFISDLEAQKIPDLSSRISDALVKGLDLSGFTAELSGIDFTLVNPDDLSGLEILKIQLDTYKQQLIDAGKGTEQVDALLNILNAAFDKVASSAGEAETGLDSYGAQYTKLEEGSYAWMKAQEAANEAIADGQKTLAEASKNSLLKYQDQIDKLRELAAEMARLGLNDRAKEILDLANALSALDFGQVLSDGQKELNDLVGGGAKEWETYTAKLREASEAAKQSGQDQLANQLAATAGQIERINKALDGLGAVSKVGDLIGGALGGGISNIGNFGSQLIKGLGDLSLTGIASTAEALKGIGTEISGLIDEFTGLTAATKAADDAMSDLEAAGKRVGETFGDTGLSQKIERLKLELERLKAISSGPVVVLGVADQIKAVEEQIKQLTEIANQMGELGQGIPSALVNGITKGALTGDWKSAKEEMLKQFEQSILEAIVQMAVDTAILGSALGEKIAHLAELAKEAIKTGDWTAFNAELKDTRAEAEAIFDNIAENIGDSFAKAKTVAEQSVTELWASLKSAKASIANEEGLLGEDQARAAYDALVAIREAAPDAVKAMFPPIPEWDAFWVDWQKEHASAVEEAKKGTQEIRDELAKRLNVDPASLASGIKSAITGATSADDVGKATEKALKDSVVNGFIDGWLEATANKALYQNLSNNIVDSLSDGVLSADEMGVLQKDIDAIKENNKELYNTLVALGLVSSDIAQQAQTIGKDFADGMASGLDSALDAVSLDDFNQQIEDTFYKQVKDALTKAFKESASQKVLADAISAKLSEILGDGIITPDELATTKPFLEQLKQQYGILYKMLEALGLGAKGAADNTTKMADAVGDVTESLYNLPDIVKVNNLAYNSANATGSIPAFADGGIVYPSIGGTIARVAEAGQPEAIIPLNRLPSIMNDSYKMSQSGGKSGVSLAGATININGVQDIGEIMRQIQIEAERQAFAGSGSTLGG